MRTDQLIYLIKEFAVIEKKVFDFSIRLEKSI